LTDSGEANKFLHYSTMSHATRFRERTFNLFRADRGSFTQTDTQSEGNRSTLFTFRCESEKKSKLTNMKRKEKKRKETLSRFEQFVREHSATAVQQLYLP